MAIPSWLTLSQTSGGSGGGNVYTSTVTVSCDSNAGAERSCTLVVQPSAAGLPAKEITVTQAASGQGGGVVIPQDFDLYNHEFFTFNSGESDFPSGWPEFYIDDAQLAVKGGSAQLYISFGITKYLSLADDNSGKPRMVCIGRLIFENRGLIPLNIFEDRDEDYRHFCCACGVDNRGNPLMLHLLAYDFDNPLVAIEFLGELELLKGGSAIRLSLCYATNERSKLNLSQLMLLNSSGLELRESFSALDELTGLKMYVANVYVGQDAENVSATTFLSRLEFMSEQSGSSEVFVLTPMLGSNMFGAILTTTTYLRLLEYSPITYLSQIASGECITSMHVALADRPEYFTLSQIFVANDNAMGVLYSGGNHPSLGSVQDAFGCSENVAHLSFWAFQNSGTSHTLGRLKKWKPVVPVTMAGDFGELLRIETDGVITCLRDIDGEELVSCTYLTGDL